MLQFKVSIRKESVKNRFTMTMIAPRPLTPPFTRLPTGVGVRERRGTETARGKFKLTPVQRFATVSGLNMFPGNGVHHGLRYVFSCLLFCGC